MEHPHRFVRSAAPSLGRGCWLSQCSRAQCAFRLQLGAKVNPCNVYLGSDIAIDLSLPDPGERMKVTVDTRHDSLEEALATVRAAFGSSGTSSSGGEHTAKRAQPAGSAAARPLAKRLPARRAAHQDDQESVGSQRTEAHCSDGPNLKYCPSRPGGRDPGLGQGTGHAGQAGWPPPCGSDSGLPGVDAQLSAGPTLPGRAGTSRRPSLRRLTVDPLLTPGARGGRGSLKVLRQVPKRA